MEKAYLLIYCFLLAIVITSLLIPSIISVSFKKRLFDSFSDRKIHSVKTPSIGGFAIFAGILITTIVFWDQGFTSEFKFLGIGLIGLFCLGLKDDLVEVDFRTKFIFQILFSSLLFFGGARVTSLFGILGIYKLMPVVSYALTVLTFVGLINAYNLIDGLDGLAGGIGFIGAVTFAILFYQIDAYQYAVIALALAGSLLAFLRYNFNPAKIFMGDTGSLILGFMMAFLSVKFMQLAAVTPIISTATHAPIVIALGIVLIPVLDTLRVFTTRMLAKKSPFEADNSHIHHLMLKAGFTARTSALLLYGLTLAVLTLSIILAAANLFLAIGILLFCFAIAVGAIYLKIENPEEQLVVKQLQTEQFLIPAVFTNILEKGSKVIGSFLL